MELAFKTRLLKYFFQIPRKTRNIMPAIDVQRWILNFPNEFLINQTKVRHFELTEMRFLLVNQLFSFEYMFF